MKNFKRSGGEDRSRGGFERREERGPRDDSRPAFQAKHDATCSDCGRVCQVPFRPNGKKPVFCTDCFSAKRGAPTTKSFEQREHAPRQYHEAPREVREQRPTAPAPQVRDIRIDELKAELSAMHSKIDRIMNALDTKKTIEAPKVMVAPKVEKKIVQKAAPVAKKPVAKSAPKTKAKPVAKKKK